MEIPNLLKVFYRETRCKHKNHQCLTLGSITGLISTDEVLGEIFSKFCIGK